MLRLPSAMFILLLMMTTVITAGCGGTDFTGFSNGREIPVTLTLDQIEHAKAHISEIRPGISRGEMWDQLVPMLDGIKPQTVDDSAPASNTTQSYDLGHGYILRVFFEPKNDAIFRRAEIVSR